jgi:hypothetical protein
MDKPTLGKVLGQLRSQPHLWKLGVAGPNDDHSIEPLTGMLGLLWPNPDRHGNPAKRRTPTLEEARAVVHLAVTIVQWGRDGIPLRTLQQIDTSEVLLWFPFQEMTLDNLRWNLHHVEIAVERGAQGHEPGQGRS